MGCLKLWDGKNKAAVAQENAGKRVQCLTGAGENLIKKRVPEKKLQQDRDVLKKLNIDRCQSG